MKKCDMCDEEFDVIDAEYIFKDYLIDHGYSTTAVEKVFDEYFDDDMCGWCNVGHFMDHTC